MDQTPVITLFYRGTEGVCRLYLCAIIYSPKKEMQHVEKYNLLQIFNIILNTEISITLL